MGFRFRKRFKIIPGIWLNLSKSGVSTSIGGKGVTVNLGHDKTKTTVGIPGTGIGYSETERHDIDGQGSGGPGLRGWLLALVVLVVALILAHG